MRIGNCNKFLIGWIEVFKVRMIWKFVEIWRRVNICRNGNPLHKVDAANVIMYPFDEGVANSGLS